MLTRINARNFVWINKSRLRRKTEQIINIYAGEPQRCDTFYRRLFAVIAKKLSNIQHPSQQHFLQIKSLCKIASVINY
jgi:hypothetical protein